LFSVGASEKTEKSTAKKAARRASTRKVAKASVETFGSGR
jgi:hypothetical protein